MARRIPLLRGGHGLKLLQGSAEFFPALIAAIDAARVEVRLETYIFDVTGGGAEIAYALERAGRRGLNVQVVVDGVGTGDTPPGWLLRMQLAGVQWRVYSPPGHFGLLSPGQWRRLHRKLCVVDGRTGFCGGINILDDFHDPNHGPLEAPRLDFAVRVTGPLVAQMHAAMAQLWLRIEAANRLRQAQLTGALVSLRAAGREVADPPAARLSEGTPRAKAALVLRDNLRNRSGIEEAYRRAIARARVEIVIANAYFIPGRKIRTALLQAARRGVRVRLLLHGRYEYFMQYYAASAVIGELLRGGVEVHEYSPSFLHAKVAVIDGLWATVGSSNLDPISMLLAREANVVVEDPFFAARLRQRLEHAMLHEGRPLARAEYDNRPVRRRLGERLALLVMRIGLVIEGKSYL